MPKIQYQNINFSTERMSVVANAIRLIDEYQKQGYSLTLRQLYYRFVATDLFPADWKYTRDANGKWKRDPNGTNNAEPNYKTLGDIIGDARMAGMIDWTAIEDRTREVDGNAHWRDPEHIIDAVYNQYMIDKWEGQQYRVEVWVEKDALEGVVGQAAKAMDVQFFSCRGYASATSLWDAGQRLKKLAEIGAEPVILHLGDHDPSGIDMSRDIEARVRLFMDEYGESLTVERIALNMDQVRAYNPPPNPAKVTDSRFVKYQDEYGDESWELDALDPAVIDRLVRERIGTYRDEKQFEKLLGREQKEKSLLRRCSEQWDSVVVPGLKRK